VLVDEYQDTNRLQAAIIQGMKPDGQGVMVVGDDAQSIYAFRGATVRNILDFPQAFSQPARHHAGPQLPLDPAHPGCLQRRDRGGAGTPCEDAVDG
jgi:superfamily I DNA/RNA helicase